MSNTPDFNYYYRVESLASEVSSSRRPAAGVDWYVHVVAFNDTRDHEEMVREYLSVYCRVDPDSEDSRQRGLMREHFLCAGAILTYYLRSAVNRRVEVKHSSQPVYEPDLPQTAPVYLSDVSAIWLVSREENIPGRYSTG